MIDYPRFPISETHLRKFFDTVAFQNWNVNFKTEVCSETVDPHITMGELMTLRSIVGRTDFFDYDMLGAMIASAMKKLLDRHVYFRRRGIVEEQRAQKYDRFLRRKADCLHTLRVYSCT